VQWLPLESWAIIQIDNSTTPLEDEIELMESVFNMSVSNKAGANSSFVLDGPDLGSKAAALIFFVLVFEWHVHVVASTSKNGKRLSLQDGVVYFFGSDRELADAIKLVERLKLNPLMIGRG
jgi:hypothetical protein